MIKLTLILDPDEGEQFVGLAAKAYGRGELGIEAMRIEREAAEPKIAPVKQSAIAKLVARREPRKRQGYYIGMRAVKSGKPNGATIILRALLTEPTRDELGARLNASGFNRNGLGATLSKLKARGYVKRTGEGEWRLTPKGHELEERLRESVAS